MSDWQKELADYSGMVVKTARMTASTLLPGVRIDADPMHLDEIPAAMDKMGWSVAARLMRRWFATSPAYEMPAEIRTGRDAKGQMLDYRTLPARQVDQEIIKTSWLMRFPSVQATSRELLENWNNNAGVVRLKKLLSQAGWMPYGNASLGASHWTALDLEAGSQINSRPLGSYLDVLNDLYGAVFKATLKIAVVGKAFYSHEYRSDIFCVERLGIYLRDTYDFNFDPLVDGSIGLGIWSRDRILSKIETADYLTATMLRRALIYPGFVPVANHDFYRWRSRHHSGGDFFVFSDVHWVDPALKIILLTNE